MKAIFATLLVFTFVVLQACSDPKTSSEDQIREFIETGVESAENRDLDSLKQQLHDNYLDQKGYNKKQLGALLRAYIFRHKNIYLFTKIEEIELLSDNEAVVRLYVAMAGSVISDVDALSTQRAQIYEFDLQLIKDSRWLLHHASWKPASIVDFE